MKFNKNRNLNRIFVKLTNRHMNEYSRITQYPPI